MKIVIRNARNLTYVQSAEVLYCLKKDYYTEVISGTQNTLNAFTVGKFNH